MLRSVLAFLIVLLTNSVAGAGEVDVIEVRLIQTGDGVYRADVTVEHADEGWDHYADGWSVSLEDGTELGYRTLHHPHVNEQPFTRSLTGIAIPDEATHVVVRAHDSVHEWGGSEMTVEVPR